MRPHKSSATEPTGGPLWLAPRAPELARILDRSVFLTATRFGAADISVQTVAVVMRDGVHLATDLYLPPELPAPAIAYRTPYGRAADVETGIFMSLARRGYVVASQDCRGTGQSQPEEWDYYVYESEDSYDFVDWISQQRWSNGFIGSFGGSYSGQTQWPMALHPKMSTIVPSVSGLGVAVNTMRLHMFLNAYARSVGKGSQRIDVPFAELEGQMLDETLSSGYFNDPLHVVLPEATLMRFSIPRDQSPSSIQQRLWSHYCRLTSAERAALVKAITGAQNVSIVEIESLPRFFGQNISHDRHTLPRTNTAELAREIRTPVLLRTGWYDWGLNDALATWDHLMKYASESVRRSCRLFISPSAHNMPGYHEGMGDHPALHHAYTAASILELLLRWYRAVQDDSIDDWPVVTYYLMGANMWAAADAWPPGDSGEVALYLTSSGHLTPERTRGASPPTAYTYDPENPTPTVGGSIVSYVYPPGSVDVTEVQARADVVSFTSGVLTADVDIVGPLRMVLFASSSAVDTDFAARLSDVFPDGRAIQLQNGMIRTRYREIGQPSLLEPGRIYCFEIDMWATANRFKAGHRIRVDISSADFPRFDRNANRGGEPGSPVKATQRVYHDVDHPSHILISALGNISGLSTTPAQVATP